MTKLLAHIKSNAVAYLALFVALGGTGYAATALPANSVGTKQLRNGAVTAKKLNGGIGGYVLDWAQITPGGSVTASKPRASTFGWNSNPQFFIGGHVTWHHAIPKSCFVLATDQPGPAGSSVAASLEPGSKKSASAYVQLSTLVGVSVAVICPSG